MKSKLEIERLTRLLRVEHRGVGDVGGAGGAGVGGGGGWGRAEKKNLLLSLKLPMDSFGRNIPERSAGVTTADVKQT